MKRLSIVLAVTEGAAYLHASVGAAIAVSADLDMEAEFFVVAPASKETATREQLSAWTHLHVFVRDTESLAQLYNCGADGATGDAILFLREGVLLQKEVLQALYKALAADEHIGAVGPFTNRTVYEWQYLNAERLAADGVEPSAALKRSWTEPTDSLFLENFALLVRRDVFDGAGRFCTDFPWVGGEDIDLSFRLKCRGYQLLRVPVYLPHIDTELYRVCDMVRTKSRPLLLQAWGLDIGLPESLWQKALMAIDWQQDPSLIHATCRSVLLRAPLVSIFLMTYNRPAYFREALESALAQTYPNIEIIIGDFGTDDRTEQLVQGYLADRRIRYVRDRTNSPKEEHHLLFEPLAQGDYIQWLMDDDMLLPDKLTLMVDAFLRHPNVTLVTSQRGVIDAEGHFMGMWNVPMSLHGSYEVLSGTDIGKTALMECSNFIGEPSIVLYKCTGDIKIAETIVAKGHQFLVDIAMWLHFLAQGDCVIFTQALGLCRRHGAQESAQRNGPIHAIVEWKKLMEEYRDSNILSKENYHRGLQKIKELSKRYVPLSHMLEPYLRQALEDCYNL